MIVSLTILLIIVAFSFYAAMYVLQFRYYISVFSTLGNEIFWNPDQSYLNKWKIDNDGKILVENGKRVERFPGSSTIFVFVTDGWHLFQFFFENSIMSAIAINFQGAAFYMGFIFIRILYSIFFNSLFDRFLIIKKYRGNKV